MKSERKDGNNRFPDARVKGIRDFFNIVREQHDWCPEYITRETFETLDLSSSKETNAIYALMFLGIIDEKGSPTVEFSNLRGNFSDTLNRLVKTKYAKLFNIIPIKLMTQKTLVNFFVQQGYAIDTAEYQSKLFVALCENGGIALPNVEESFHRARFDKEK
jgi:hypothetical protein